MITHMGVKYDKSPLLSLWQIMFEYKLNDLALGLGAIISASRDLSTADTLKQPICTEDYAKIVGTNLSGLATMCGNFNADPSLTRHMRMLSKALIDGSADRREAVLSAQLVTIIEGIQTNLASRKFMFIPADQAVYWGNAELFGDDFIFGFPRPALHEMLEAGNCFAAGRWTATVFHCMRVAEYGLRKLAKNLRVTISSKGKNCPVEYGDWDTVITAIRNKIKEIRNLPRGAKKEQNLKFYSSAADHCEYMKDIWRNEISHTRRRYSKSESLAAINRVKEFVQPLAKTGAKRAIKKRIKQTQHPINVLKVSGSSSLTSLQALLGKPGPGQLF
jgi:hypothetical protein